MYIFTYRITMASKLPEDDDPMTGKKNPELKTKLEIKEVLDFYTNWNYPKRMVFIQKLIEDTGLSLTTSKTDEIEKEFVRLKDLLTGRWNKLYKSWKDAHYKWKDFKRDPDDVFIDLRLIFQTLSTMEQFLHLVLKLQDHQQDPGLKKKSPSEECGKILRIWSQHIKDNLLKTFMTQFKRLLKS